MRSGSTLLLLALATAVFAQTKPGAQVFKIGFLGFVPNDPVKFGHLDRGLPGSAFLAMEEINNDTTRYPDVEISIQNVPTFIPPESSSRTATLRFWDLMNNGTTMVVGPPSSDQLTVLSPLSDVFSTSVVSYGATKSEFSDKIKHPNTFRTLPPDHFSTRVIAHFLAEQKWNPVAVVSINTDFGNGLLHDFIESCKVSNVEIGHFIRLAKTRDGIRGQFRDLKNLAIRNVVMLSGSSLEITDVLNVTAELEMMGEGSGYLYVLPFTTTSLSQSVLATYSKRLAGMVSMPVATFNWDDPALSVDWVNRVNEVSNRYLGVTRTLAVIRSVPFSVASYKAVYAVAEGLQIMINDARIKNATFKFKNSDFAAAIKSGKINIPLMGGAETLSFDENGDPLRASYNLVNAVRNATSNKISFRLFRTYHMEAASRKFDKVSVLPLLFPDGSEIMPEQFRSTFLVENSSFKSALIAVYSILAVLLVGTLGLFVSFRHLKILRFTSWVFSTTSLAGLLLTATSVLIHLAKPSFSSIVAMHSLLSIGLCLILGAVYLKNFRIYELIVKQIALTDKAFKLSDKDLLVKLFGVLTVQTALLIVWAQTLNPGIEKEYQDNMFEVVGVLAQDRAYRILSFFVVYAVPMGLLVSSTLVSIMTRNVLEKKYNESIVAGTVIYSMVLLSAFVLLNSIALLPNSGLKRNIVNAFLILVGDFLVFMLYCSKTIYLVVNEAFFNRVLYTTDVVVDNAPSTDPVTSSPVKASGTSGTAP